MKTYLQNGLQSEILGSTTDEFYIQEMNEYSPVRYIYPGDDIKYKLDSELVSLYDTFRDLIFDDINAYYDQLNYVPITKTTRSKI